MSETVTLSTLLTVLDANASRFMSVMNSSIEQVNKLNQNVEAIGSKWEAMSSKVNRTGFNLVGQIAAMAGLTLSVGEAVKKYIEFDKVNTMLEESLSRVGGKTNDTSQKILANAAALREFARAVQVRTTYSEEQIIAMASRGLERNIPVDKIQGTVSTAIGIAATLRTSGVSAVQVMEMISRASMGQTYALRRLSMMLRENVTQQNMADVLTRRAAQGMELEEHYANSLTGQLIRLRNSWHELLQDVGQIIVVGLRLNVVFEAMLRGVRAIKEWLEGLSETKRNLIARVVMLSVVMGGLMLSMSLLFKTVSFGFGIFKGLFSVISMLLSPTTLFVVALVGIGAALAPALLSSQKFGEIWGSIKDTLHNFGTKSMTQIVDGLAPVLRWAQDLWETLKRAGATLVTLTQQGQLGTVLALAGQIAISKMLEYVIRSMRGVGIALWDVLTDAGIWKAFWGLLNATIDLMGAALSIVMKEAALVLVGVLYHTPGIKTLMPGSFEETKAGVNDWFKGTGYADPSYWMNEMGKDLKTSVDGVVGMFGNLSKVGRDLVSTLATDTHTIDTDNPIKQLKDVWNSATPKYADGIVHGSGGPRSDTVAAWLSPGEAVINAASTRKYAALLSHINAAGGGKRFASGGRITAEMAEAVEAGSVHGSTKPDFDPIDLAISAGVSGAEVKAAFEGSNTLYQIAKSIFKRNISHGLAHLGGFGLSSAREFGMEQHFWGGGIVNPTTVSGAVGVGLGLGGDYLGGKMSGITSDEASRWGAEQEQNSPDLTKYSRYAVMGANFAAGASKQPAAMAVVAAANIPARMAATQINRAGDAQQRAAAYMGADTLEARRIFISKHGGTTPEAWRYQRNQAQANAQAVVSRSGVSGVMTGAVGQAEVYADRFKGPITTDKGVSQGFGRPTSVQGAGKGLLDQYDAIRARATVYNEKALQGRVGYAHIKQGIDADQVAGVNPYSDQRVGAVSALSGTWDEGTKKTWNKDFAHRQALMADVTKREKALARPDVDKETDSYKEQTLALAAKKDQVAELNKKMIELPETSGAYSKKNLEQFKPSADQQLAMSHISKQIAKSGDLAAIASAKSRDADLIAFQLEQKKVLNPAVAKAGPTRSFDAAKNEMGGSADLYRSMFNITKGNGNDHMGSVAANTGKGGAILEALSKGFGAVVAAVTGTGGSTDGEASPN